ncbi:MAG: hypothetical protein A4S09_04180 [Proteobacteria bacterium SG_bin7]|nr:MAG: hypothetical protein A4S09_04180 [Proteobacteria bacterium SG_bin7]
MSLLVFCLVLVVGYLEMYRGFQFYFSGTDKLKVQVKELKEKAKQNELNLALSKFQFEDFRQEVATHLPAVEKQIKSQENSFTVRNIASIAQIPSEKMKLERAASMFEKGKKFFREKNFYRANKTFSSLLKKYPESLHSVESYFFLVEGLFQLREFEECVLSVETMMTHYPENELTGFSLLRLGKVYEAQERLEDAAEVYRTIRHNYSSSELKQQAEVFLKAIQL